MTSTFFKCEKSDSKARAGVFYTNKGPVHTPVFMPVGTCASVKMLDQTDLNNLGPEIILGNTYHLYLRPGDGYIQKSFGDLHHFMGWEKSILTDSGGFQVYSLSGLRKITPEGVHFQSHIDGSSHFIGPKESMQIQKNLGSDIVMCFDECPSLPATEKELDKAIERTLDWAKVCREFELRSSQKLFGIVQGGLDLQKRLYCLEELKKMNFPGMAIGGLSVGEKNEEMWELCESFVHQMEENKPRYLMGVGTPLDVMKGIKSGVDMFDCVYPTRNARNGQAFTKEGPLNIKKKMFKEDKGSLDKNCQCHTCKTTTRAYLHHLYKAKEGSVQRLITIHNLHFYLELVRGARKAIISGEFDNYFTSFYNSYESRRWLN